MSIYSLYPIKQILVSSIQDYYPILTFNLKIKRKIVTFAGLFAYFGIAHQYGKGIRFDPPSELEFLGGGELWGRVPIGIFITLAILVLLSYLYNYHTFGQYVKAIGGNEKASSLAGVNVDKTEILYLPFNGHSRWIHSHFIHRKNGFI
ncbi:MAG: ABC transporter permease subunit [Candidatus Hadarchaeia archaeon]